MPNPILKDGRTDRPKNGPQSDRPGAAGKPMSDEDAQHALDQGDNGKIDRALDELDVSTTESGKDQTAKPDTEGSNSSSKNLDEQGD
ncbi:hypothetical protein EVC45_26730 [Paraburkholderia sp. UYCP14C]|uniref:hypothetical protein n=1 Tax=Paraburkholderia sp. UYCP14C TaxID=2511130 RepID=UPI0010208564|nr:hypothetical protein [Paraburkholderia sp. UYCP14C]RZF26624.1 hypothetical protein EVC45_26730 [Paraburkholderia sp. UYCP14C]